jgi:hypothetical protein
MITEVVYDQIVPFKPTSIQGVPIETDCPQIGPARTLCPRMPDVDKDVLCQLLRDQCGEPANRAMVVERRKPGYRHDVSDAIT